MKITKVPINSIVMKEINIGIVMQIGDRDQNKEKMKDQDQETEKVKKNTMIRLE